MTEVINKRKRTLPVKFEDYVIEGDAKKVLIDVKNKNPTCTLKDVRSTMEELQKEINTLASSDEKYDVNDLLGKLDELMVNNRKTTLKHRRLNGGGIGAPAINSTAFILYLLIDAMKKEAKLLQTEVFKLLQGSLKVLEFLSNKDNCLEQVLYSLLDSRIISFIKYFMIGEAFRETNPLPFIIKILNFLPVLFPYAVNGLYVTSVTSIGFIVYHFITYYTGKISKSMNIKLQSFKDTLTALEKANSKDVVEKVNIILSKLKTNTVDLLDELNKMQEQPILSEEERTEFMKKIRKEIQEFEPNHIGEFIDVEKKKDPLNRMRSRSANNNIFLPSDIQRSHSISPHKSNRYDNSDSVEIDYDEYYINGGKKNNKDTKTKTKKSKRIQYKKMNKSRKNKK